MSEKDKTKSLKLSFSTYCSLPSLSEVYMTMQYSTFPSSTLWPSLEKGRQCLYIYKIGVPRNKENRNANVGPEKQNYHFRGLRYLKERQKTCTLLAERISTDNCEEEADCVRTYLTKSPGLRTLSNWFYTAVDPLTALTVVTNKFGNFT